MSEPSEEWEDVESPDRRIMSNRRSLSNGTRRPRASSIGSSDLRSPSPGSDDGRSRRSSSKSRRSRRSRTRTRTPADKKSQKREVSRGGSSSYQGAADLDDAWYKTFKDRLTKGVDMKQVKKVGLDAAAVAAVKVAVGTQIPWKQRIPKTIAVGLAAAVTDFLVSKTSLQPKGMVGTMYARQFVEIALANLIINPASNKVQQKFSGTKAGQGAKAKPGDRTPASGGATRGAGGRGRR
ncbi:hypothetical protein N0V82_010569 [Gnomoniopsis sp. IMI 355080]|nr:hypothetical protein N0V82_010569 [Gnomoniopsis sp. IMI 355080]